MSSEERKQILKMIEEGKITPEEGVNLLEALDDNSIEDEAPYRAQAAPNSRFDPLDGLDEVASRVRSYWYIPMWIGVGFTVLGGLIMYWAMQASGFNFWFYCAWFPLFLGVLVVALAAGGHRSHWLFVSIKRSPDSVERDISLGFPLPFGLGAWVLRNFGHYIPNLNETIVNELLRVLEESPIGEPQLVVDVLDDEDGDHVQVFVA
ncbi:MAG: hypothetical protein H8E29_16630 [Anaerolineales bacterium]|uniref:YvlB/LiaX N-terminal domain-containing protein n=1 Tax=Candidatus Desulfolinea nitratireducens TaxID=2841698 RepID=A0A8J6TKH7_9CHLR|nr:hypothetical protein [Candidatus Desulfolinea nitratireducens]